MKLRNLLGGALFLFCTTFYSQTLTQTVKGRVLELETNMPIFGVNITVINSDKGGVTDEKGYFRIENMSVGRTTFLASSIGYEDVVVSEVLIGSAKEVDLEIYLMEAIGQLDEVLIVAKDKVKPYNEVAAVSARAFSVEETKRFPASISDPGRMAQSFAGVGNTDDETNEIVIRGNAPNQLLWRIEGVEVPEPNHFSEEGYSSGAVSMLSSNMLGNSDFFTGAFPAEYGNAISGVFDINLRNGNSEKTEASFQFGVLGTDFAIEGPFSKNSKASYLVNYRYSTLSLLDKMIDISDGSTPTYQDLSFKIKVPIGEKTNLSIWGIGGWSEENEDDQEYNGYINNEFFESKTYMSGISLDHIFKKQSKLKFGVSFSGNASDFVYNERNDDTEYNYKEIDKLKNDAIRITADYSKKFSSQSTLKVGGVVSLLSYDFLTVRNIQGENNIDVNENGNGTMFQLYAQEIYRFNSKLSGSIGLHGTYFSINEDTSIEPRLGLEWKFLPKHTLSAGFGIHSRKMPLNQYFVQIESPNGANVTPNTNLDLMRATHYVLGYDWRVIRNGHLKIEAYYQRQNNVAVSKNPDFTDSYVNGYFIKDALSDTGVGRNYGIDFTFEKFFSNQYYFLMTTSVFDSKYEALDKNWYSSRFNTKFNFNLVGGKEFSVGKGKNNILGINGKVMYKGGNLGTPLDLEIYEETGNLELNQGLRNSVQFKDYFRVDVSFNYRLNRPKVAHIFSLDIQNATNRDNVYLERYNPETDQIETYYQLGLIPIINYKIEF